MSLLPELPLCARELRGWAHQRRLRVLRVLAVLSLAAPTAQFVAGQTWPSAIHHGGTGLIGHGDSLSRITLIVLAVLTAALAPAIGAGGIAALRERDGLDLVRLTRLGPARVVIEAWLARTVLLLSFLVLGAPLLAFAVACGGVETGHLVPAVAILCAAAVQGAAIGLAAGAWARDTAGAMILSYLAVAAVWVGVPLRGDWGVRSGLEGAWGAWGLSPLCLLDRPSMASLHHLWLTGLSLALALGLAHAGLMRPAAAATGWTRRLLDWLDRQLPPRRRHDGRDLPGDRPLRWRLARGDGLMDQRWLLRWAIPAAALAAWLCVAYGGRYQHPERAIAATWTALVGGLCLLLLVRGAAITAGLRGDGSLSTLLATPLPARALVLDQAAALRRLHLIGLVPVLAALIGSACASRGLTVADVWYDHGVQLPLALLDALLLPQLALAIGLVCGLRARSRARAVTLALGLVAMWCFLGLLTVAGARLAGLDPRTSPHSGSVRILPFACCPGLLAMANLDGDLTRRQSLAAGTIQVLAQGTVLAALWLLIHARAGRWLRR